MKQIIIMRHAKSDWSTGDPDFDRPLNKRGKKAAPVMGSEILKRDIVPELILSSPAKRAKQTLKKVVKAMNYEGEIEYHDEFYSAHESNIIEAIQKVDDKYSRIMILGHNPTLESLISVLVNKKTIDITMPTAAVALLETDMLYWKILTLKSCHLKLLLKPKEL